jgi:ADP-ribose pyrophosphatase
MPIFDFTHQDVEILGKEVLFQGFGKIVRYKIRHQLFSGGLSLPFQREIYQRCNAVTVIPYDPVLDKVVLIEQFRAGALLNKHTPWLLELVAGIIDKDKTAEEIAYLEMKEETGLEIQKLTPVYSYYNSPGSSSEYVALFCAIIDASDAGGIHGLQAESEDIKVHVLDSKDAFAAVKNGTICNASSIIALQWLELHLKASKSFC